MNIYSHRFSSYGDRRVNEFGDLLKKFFFKIQAKNR